MQQMYYFCKQQKTYQEIKSYTPMFSTNLTDKQTLDKRQLCIKDFVC